VTRLMAALTRLAGHVSGTRPLLPRAGRFISHDGTISAHIQPGPAAKPPLTVLTALQHSAA
jgi:hypothetical protein